MQSSSLKQLEDSVAPNELRGIRNSPEVHIVCIVGLERLP